ncbi:NADase-type glycan-binding domain-containing protein [Shimia aestuarii]|uniref:NAD glycohydrolase translocation F5/8 type C domain-containing protein n=1 Tax=Shimia aestuarii TaxID=254406 RepID=A0A1I4LK68_9RHOB|nr:hypothetical protein [Shimia aestuarii]SFL91362.1 hypothetical protein SAMN04488042_102125 [Shimia aestuarii]
MKRPIYAFSSLVALASPLAAQPLCETMLGTQAFDYQSICVSSALAPQSGNRYDIGSMRDANDYTAWCEGVPGPGIGEQITLSYRFAGPLERIWISNGYAKSPKSFADNGRIRDITVHFWAVDDPQRRTLQYRLADHGKEQPIPIPWTTLQPRAIEIVIDSVYPGARWQDTCVNEFWPDFGM